VLNGLLNELSSIHGMGEYPTSQAHTFRRPIELGNLLLSGCVRVGFRTCLSGEFSRLFQDLRLSLDLNRSEREVMVIARAATQGRSEEWSRMVCRRAMPPTRTILPQGESQLKMWILRALSTLVLQGVEVMEWSYEFLVSEQQFWWVYRGKSQSGGDPDLSELDRGEPILDAI
jgi:hypothetical protein